jgi:hypothetical protein
MATFNSPIQKALNITSSVDRNVTLQSPITIALSITSAISEFQSVAVFDPADLGADILLDFTDGSSITHSQSPAPENGINSIALQPGSSYAGTIAQATSLANQYVLYEAGNNRAEFNGDGNTQSHLDLSNTVVLTGDFIFMARIEFNGFSNDRLVAKGNSDFIRFINANSVTFRPGVVITITHNLGIPIGVDGVVTLKRVGTDFITDWEGTSHTHDGTLDTGFGNSLDFNILGDDGSNNPVDGYMKYFMVKSGSITAQQETDMRAYMNGL